jgi:hypothetical protein
MKQKNLFLSVFVIVALSTNAYSQTGVWGTSTDETYTSGNVGINATSVPTDARLKITGLVGPLTGAVNIPELRLYRQEKEYTVSGPLVTAPANIFEIYRRNISCAGCIPTTPVLIDEFDESGWLGIRQPVPTAELDVNGNAIIEKNLTVDLTATIHGNAKIGEDLTVSGGQIDMTIPGDGSWRNIQAHSSLKGLVLSANASSANGASIELYGPTSAGRPGRIHYMSYSTTSAASASGIGLGHVFYNYDPTNNWVPSMAITNSGKVIIGSDIIGTENTPGTYDLYVSGGGILATTVKVATVGGGYWSDFVFNKDYKLNTLGEVESYINANNHLPGVPSASEVEKDGIDVASMDAKLLQKIEELTLYVIDQQKQIEEQNKKIEVLTRKVNN